MLPHQSRALLSSSLIQSPGATAQHSHNTLHSVSIRYISGLDINTCPGQVFEEASDQTTMHRNARMILILLHSESPAQLWSELLAPLVNMIKAVKMNLSIEKSQPFTAVFSETGWP